MPFGLTRNPCHSPVELCASCLCLAARSPQSARLGERSLRVDEAPQSWQGGAAGSAPMAGRTSRAAGVPSGRPDRLRMCRAGAPASITSKSRGPASLVRTRRWSSRADSLPSCFVGATVFSLHVHVNILMLCTSTCVCTHTYTVSQDFFSGVCQG